jgi:hypothetical protein
LAVEAKRATADRTPGTARQRRTAGGVIRSKNQSGSRWSSLDFKVFSF